MNCPLYSIILETDAAGGWSYFSEDLPGYTGVGDTLFEALQNALEGMEEYIEFLREVGAVVPDPNPNPTISFRHETAGEIHPSVATGN